MKETYIYALVDPRDNQIRYIGKADDPQERLRKHIGEARKVKGREWWNKYKIVSPKLRWIDFLIRNKQKPLLVILEKCSYDNWQEVENGWILKFISAGAELTNTNTPAGYPNLARDRQFKWS